MNLVIFGAGEWGRVAYYYYEKEYVIEAFIDNDVRIQGTTVLGVPVFSPDYLLKHNVRVVIANKRHKNEIAKQLYDNYNIKGVIVFELKEYGQFLFDENIYHQESEIEIAFSHGLGNQMFQYVIYAIMKKNGKKATADLSAYLLPGMMKFELEDVFPGIKMEKANSFLKQKYIGMGGTYFYHEEPPKNNQLETFDIKMLEMKEGYIEGWHSSYKYAELIEEQLKEDFSFRSDIEDKLREFIQKITRLNTVSVQIRRGDFLESKYYREIGCHCTEQYYSDAIDYVKSKISNPVFIFLSNDIEWVKENLFIENAIYVDSSMFKTYQKWYDMLIMSKCKNNIIPNSTFGWWGAWLNQNENKIVVAPKEWRTNWRSSDWCPKDWIRM